MRILMCRPDFYAVKYEINPWMDLRLKVNGPKATHQWEALHKTLLACGAQIDLVQPAPDWPDMVFTANAGLLYQGKIILSHFKYKERQGETYYFDYWFRHRGFEILNPIAKNLEEAPFEGEGDALFCGKKLFVAYGFRTAIEFYEKAPYLDKKQIVFCELIDPYFYHLDTCFCPLSDTQALWYPPAFTLASRQRMAEQIELIPVEEVEAKRFACNAVVLGKQVILPSQCPNISATLKNFGFTPHNCDMSEYMKAGGACKCLTMRLSIPNH